MEHRGEGSRLNNVPDSVVEQIMSCFGSLDEPTFFFLKEDWRRSMYHGFLGELAATLLQDMDNLFSISNVTDLNADHCLVLRVDGVQGWILELSFVGRFAALFRIVPHSIQEIFQPDLTAALPAERIFVQLLRKHEIELLGPTVLEIPFHLRLFYTEPENGKVYQALFRDVDVLPWKRDLGTEGRTSPPPG